MNEKRWAGLPALVLCLVAFGVSYYLFARGVKLETNSAAGADFCSTVFEASCDGTLQSEYSHLWGLSFAGWGAVYYLTLGTLVFLSLLLRHVMHRQLLSAAIALNLGGLVVSGYLSWLLLSGKVPFCPLCFLTHLLNLGLLPTLVLFRGGGIGSVFSDLASGLDFVFGGRARASAENTARALAIVCAALVGGIALEWFVIKSAPVSSGPAAVAAPGASFTEGELLANLMQAYYDAEPVEIPLAADDPREGPADAPVQFVVFSDFECPSCKSNAKLFGRLVQTMGDRISIVYKNYPLSSDCNPSIASNPHPYACGAAFAALAAHRQGKFVPFHHLIYGAQGAPTPEVIESAAQRLGLDMSRFNADRESTLTREIIAADIELARQLKVIQTPTIFLNNRPISPPLAPHIGVIAQQLLNGAAPATPGN